MTDRKYLNELFEFAVILTECAVSSDQLVYCRVQTDDFCVATNSLTVYNLLCELKKNKNWLTVVYMEQKENNNAN